MNKLERAEKAQRLINDAEFVDAFARTRQAIFDQIERTPIRDDEGLKHLRLCLKLLNDVKANVIAVINDGKVEQFNIEQQKREVAQLSDYNRSSASRSF
jgi:hypothetical protein